MLESLLHARLWVGLIGSIAAAALVAIVAGPGDGIAAFCFAMLFFQIGLVSSDTTMPRFGRLTATSVSISAFVLLPLAVDLAQSAGLLVSIPALAFAVTLVAQDLSHRRARARVDNAPAIVGYRFGSPVFRRPDASDPETTAFDGRPSSERLVDFLRAINYEGRGMRRFAPVSDLTFSIMLFSGLAYFSSNPGMAGLFGIMMFGSGRGFLADIAYPISRQGRARVVFMSGVFRYTAYFFGVALLMWILGHSGLPRILDRPRSHDPYGVMAIAGALIWMPLCLWLAVKWRLERTAVKGGGNQAKWMLLLISTVFLAVPTSLLLPELHGGLAVQGSVFALLLIGGHSLLWFGVKRHFAKADLV
jgi:hypothetical protein